MALALFGSSARYQKAEITNTAVEASTALKTLRG
jgi:hypothetical protein